MTPQDLVAFWQTTAKEDLETAETLVEAKRYHHALFFCHLALEKLLKGLVYAKTQTHALPIHDLKKIAIQANLTLSEDQQKKLEEITTWNINARYDDYKRKFYQKASHEFTLQWMKIAKELFIWIKSQF